jgi:hypothetical protein
MGFYVILGLYSNFAIFLNHKTMITICNETNFQF